jgi:hypothetical protein
MTKNPHVNSTGMITFIICMIFATAFIIYVVVFEPGPVDVQAAPAIGMTQKQYVERIENWTKSTPESIARGEKAYKLNCSFYYNGNGQDPFLEMFKSGKLPNKGTELDVFRMISKGNAEQHILKLDHLRDDERWDLVHYLRSLNPKLPSTTSSEWKQYIKEGA